MNTFDWIEIRTNELEKVAAFYTDLFGWKVIEKENAGGTRVWIFDTNNEPRTHNLRRGGMWERPAGEAHGFIVYILVEDIGKLVKRIKELNGEVLSPIIHAGAGRLVLAADPGGNQFGMYEELSAGVEDLK